jgi:hypothetical protein
MKSTIEAKGVAASATKSKKTEEVGDWRGKMLSHLRELIHEADPEIVEEAKWAKGARPGIPVWTHDGIVCTGETYKQVVKLTFARGATLEDPKMLFNSSMDGNARRASDFREGEKVNETAFKQLIRTAVKANQAAVAVRGAKKK